MLATVVTALATGHLFAMLHVLAPCKPGYAPLKQDLADFHAHDTAGYTGAKGPFIRRVRHDLGSRAVWPMAGQADAEPAGLGHHRRDGNSIEPEAGRMGTITYLKDRLRQARQDPRRVPVTVSAYGFCFSQTFVPWQSVSEIRAWKADLVTIDEAFLEFFFGDQRIAVGEDQFGFGELEAAMIAVFPDTARWRDAVLLPAFARNETLLYRRATP